MRPTGSQDGGGENGAQPKDSGTGEVRKADAGGLRPAPWPEAPPAPESTD